MNTYSETDANYSVGTLSAFVVGAAVVLLAGFAFPETRSFSWGRSRWLSLSRASRPVTLFGGRRNGDSAHATR